jgi:CubicO group peptidase (beta-lactamase class C family)
MHKMNCLTNTRVPLLVRVLLAGIVSLAVFATADRSQAADLLYPGKTWQQATPADVGMDSEQLDRVRRYALSGGGSGMVTRHGRLVLAWGDQRHRYDLKSTTKSIGVTALGLALEDGKLKLSDRARAIHPTLGTPPESNAKTGWLDQITILQLATQTAGFAKPGGYERLLFRPSSEWHYSDGGPNWLAECITLRYQRDVRDLLFDRVFTPLGITDRDLTWRKNAYRAPTIDGIARREFGSGISANVDAMARIGYLYLRRGRWRERQILPESFIDMARHTVPQVVGLPVHDPANYGRASAHYGLLWWNNADGSLAGVPRDAYWSWGLYDSLIIVIPSQDVVAARAGKSWPRNSPRHYAVLQPLLGPLAASVRRP